MKRKEYIAFTGFIFAIVFLIHLWRLIYSVPVTIGEFDIPVWVSGLGVILAGFLAWKALKLNR